MEKTLILIEQDKPGGEVFLDMEGKPQDITAIVGAVLHYHPEVGTILMGGIIGAYVNQGKTKADFMKFIAEMQWPAL